MNAQGAQAAARLLAAFKELAANEAWQQEVMPRLRTLHDSALAGLSDRNREAHQRGEHLEAYHFAVELLRFVPDRIRQLADELRVWSAEQDSVSLRASEALE